MNWKTGMGQNVLLPYGGFHHHGDWMHPKTDGKETWNIHGNGGFEFGGTPIFRFLGHLYILLTCSWENNHQSALFYGFFFMVFKGPGFVTHNHTTHTWVNYNLFGMMVSVF